MSSASSSHSHMDCHCQQQKRRGTSSSSSDKTPSLVSGSLPSRSSSSQSLLPFPASEPSDYCRPTLSLNTHLPSHHRLAVLLPQHLWKADKDADECDTFTCPTRFTLFERKHHCRKCGGVFCQSCSSRSIPLLDTSDMPFVIPPPHLPLPLLAASSPAGHLIPSRVCDDCHAQLTGQTPPSVLARRASAAASSPLNELNTPLSSVPSLSHSPGSVYSADNGSVHSSSLYPPGTTFIAKPRHMRRPSAKRNNSTGSVQRRASTQRSTSPSNTITTHRVPSSLSQVQPSQQDFSELGLLAEYPLKVSSRGCKLSGGAWWNPKPMPRRIDSPVRYDAQVPRRVSLLEENEPEDDCEDDEGAPPVVHIRRTVARCQETAMREAPFASPELLRGKDCVSTF